MTDHICSICNGQIIEDEKMFKCQDCKFTIYKKMYGATIDAKMVSELMQNGKTSKLVRCVSRSDKPYDALLVVNKELSKVEIEFPSTETDVTCLYCKKKVKEYSVSYSCSCGLKIFKKPFGGEVTLDILKKLMILGRTDELVPCYSKTKNKPYDAYFVLNENKELSLEFKQ